MSSDGGKKPRRRRPAQSRSQATVDAIVEAAARVFRREGFGATTNRIAAEAGVSIGSLYEYFPNKEALLVVLAERHLDLAEQGINAALERSAPTRELLADLQDAIVASQRFPSQAIEIAATTSEKGSALRARAVQLRAAVLRELSARAAGLSDPELRARAAFGAIGELTARTLFEIEDAREHAALRAHLLAMAVGRFDR